MNNNFCSNRLFLAFPEDQQKVLHLSLEAYTYTGIVLNSFARKWLLRRPWANLASFLRDHSPVWVFGWAYFRSPCSCSFSCSFLVCIDIHLLSIDFPLNPKGNWRMSKIFNSCACPCIFLSENVCSFCVTYSHIVFPCPCLCFWQGGTTGQLWTWSLRHRNCMRQSVLQIQIRCRMATQTYQNIVKETTLDTLLQFPCAKPWAGLARNLRDAGFKLTQSSPQTHELNLNEGFRTIPICIYIYIYNYIICKYM